MAKKKAKHEDADSLALAHAQGMEARQTGKDGTRCMFTLSAPAIKLLDTAVLVDGVDRSEVVERLITTHLAGYYSGRGAPEATSDVERL